MKEQLNEKNELDWFKKLQKNSWNPEVIISGLTLAFILAFPRNLYEFSAYIIQDLGVNYIGGLLVLMYSSFLVNVLKIFLITHLALRFVWTGLLGVSYAFPKGVIDENLPKTLKGIQFGNIKDLTISLERICSMFFGIPVYLTLIFAPITLLLLILLAAYKIFDLNFFLVYLLFVGLLVLFMIAQLYIKKLIKNNPKATNLFSSLGAVYLSNIGKVKFQLLQFVIILISVPFVIYDTQHFTLFFHEINLSEKQIKWPLQSWFYEDQRDQGMRFGRILIPSEIIDDEHLPLKLAFYSEDEKFIYDLNQRHRATLDSLHWPELQNTYDLYRISIDDSLYTIQDWRLSISKESNQKTCNTYIPIHHLGTGFHQIRVEKLAIRTKFFGDESSVLRENWAIVNFFKK